MGETIKSVNIIRFRGIEDLKLDDMKKINILVGENNSGKTTVLEAVKLFERPFDLVSHLRVTSRQYLARGSYYSKVKDMFYQGSFRNPVEIELGVDGELKKLGIVGKEEKSLISGGLRESENQEFLENLQAMEQSHNLVMKYLLINQVINTTKLIYNFNNEKKEYEINSSENKIAIDLEQPELIKVNYSNALDYFIEDYAFDAIDNIIKEGNKQEIINILKIFDNSITDFNYTSDNEIYITNNNKISMNISNYGDGMKKALVLISKIIDAKNGIVLIDELETGIHKEIIGELFNEITTKSERYNTQIIATTHSREAVEVLLQRLENNLDHIALYRLESFNNKFYARRFSGELAYEIIVENGGDLR